MRGTALPLTTDLIVWFLLLLITRYLQSDPRGYVLWRRLLHCLLRFCFFDPPNCQGQAICRFARAAPFVGWMFVCLTRRCLSGGRKVETKSGSPMFLILSWRLKSPISTGWLWMVRKWIFQAVALTFPMAQTSIFRLLQRYVWIQWLT
jgi:hypothetical protein